MAKVNVSRTELVWPGKYNEDGTLKEVPRVSLPFQIIETVNESRATREARKTTGMPLFDEYEGKEGDSFEEGWRNKLIWGDNLLVMGSLLKRFAGKIDLIYIDPPFATGADFSFSAPVGESGESADKKASAIEEKAYRDTWGRGRGSWFEMMYDRLRLMRDLLSDKGTIYIHLDWYVGHHMRPVLDEVFGEHCSLGDIVWAYGSPSGGRVSGSKLVKAHDFIYVFAKHYGSHQYKIAYLPYADKYINDWFKYTDKDGRRFQKRQRTDKKTGRRYWERQYLDESKGVPASTVWADIRQAYADPRAYKIGTTSEITGYATQKPEKLLDRIINISSEPGDLVADFFCGSGTTLAVAEKLGRRWIGCDLGRWGIHVTRKRLLGIDKCKPFEVLNLGKYERQYWSQSTFGNRQIEERAYFEYLAFILKLYSARPVPGMAHLHGRKANAMVHVGAVDAPVTISEIQSSIDECLQNDRLHLHVLGWEWEMGLQDLMVDQARKQGVSLRLLQIPPEVMEQQATDKGDVMFFELAYVEAEVEHIAAPTGRDASSRSSRRVRICLTPALFMKWACGRDLWRLGGGEPRTVREWGPIRREWGQFGSMGRAERDLRRRSWPVGAHLGARGRRGDPGSSNRRAVGSRFFVASRPGPATGTAAGRPAPSAARSGPRSSSRAGPTR